MLHSPLTTLQNPSEKNNGFFSDANSNYLQINFPKMRPIILFHWAFLTHFSPKFYFYTPLRWFLELPVVLLTSYFLSCCHQHFADAPLQMGGASPASQLSQSDKRLCFQPLTIFKKSSITDVWRGPKYAFVLNHLSRFPIL